MTVTMMTPTDILKAESRAAHALHPYSVAEAEDLESRWALTEAQQAALDDIRRLEYLAGAR
mgnify:CR=1 FL=1